MALKYIADHRDNQLFCCLEVSSTLDPALSQLYFLRSVTSNTVVCVSQGCLKSKSEKLTQSGINDKREF